MILQVPHPQASNTGLSQWRPCQVALSACPGRLCSIKKGFTRSACSCIQHLGYYKMTTRSQKNPSKPIMPVESLHLSTCDEYIYTGSNTLVRHITPLDVPLTGWYTRPKPYQKPHMARRCCHPRGRHTNIKELCGPIPRTAPGTFACIAIVQSSDAGVRMMGPSTTPHHALPVATPFPASYRDRILVCPVNPANTGLFN